MIQPGDIFLSGVRSAEQGDIKSLKKAIESLSGTVFVAEYNYLSSYLKYLQGLPADALSNIEKVISMLSRSKSKNFIYRALMLKSVLLRRQGEYSHSNRVLNECLRHVSSKESQLVGNICNSMGVNFWMMGNFVMAKQHYRMAHRIAKRTNDNMLYLKSYINLGIIPLNQGDFFEAEVYLRNAVELCAREKQDRLRIYAQLNLGELYWLNGNWHKAKNTMEECRRLSARLGLKYEEGATLWISGNISRDEQNIQQARKYYEDALRLLEKSMSYSERIYVYLHNGILERMVKNYQKSLILFRQAQKLMDETKERLMEGYYEMEFGYLLWLMGEKTVGRKYIKSGLKKTKGRKYEQMLGQFLLFLVQTSRHKDGIVKFERLLKTCWKKGYQTIFLKEQETFLPLLCESMIQRRRTALYKSILLDLAARNEAIIDGLLEKKSRACFESALYLIEKLQLDRYKPILKRLIYDADISATPRIAEVLETMDSKRMPRLRVSFFAKFQVVRDDETVFSFPRSRVQDLLKIFILFKDKTLLKEQVMEMLWPKEETTKSFNSLRQAIFLLRECLRQYGLDGDNIIFHRSTGIYEFRYPKEKLETDLFDFLEAVRNGDAEWGKENITKALELYMTAFELYKGPFLAENRYDYWSDTFRKDVQAKLCRIVSRIYDSTKDANLETAQQLVRTAAGRDPDLIASLVKIT